MTGRPPYRTAIKTACAVLIGYLVTLAPSVTFWDAGEFITAARTLGIPHPPGTPLFVLLSNVWGLLLPFGGYAWRINLLSAICAAAAAAYWFLVAHDIIGRLHHDIDDDSRRTLATLGGVAAAFMASFSFTMWQSATEAEVYAFAMLAIAMVSWLGVRWRVLRGIPAGARALLLALYLGALAVGGHLMAALVGPAFVLLLVVEARRWPLADAAARRAEWSQIWIVAAAWLFVIGAGLGSALLAAGGLLALAAAATGAWRARQTRFALLAVLVTVVALSTVCFLLMRARQHPWLNSGNPATWHGVLDLVRRVQYPVRTPFDDPTVMHGAANPGRSVTLLAYQFANYAQYFDWQWASSLGDLALKSWARLAVTLIVFSLGIRGALAHRRTDRPSFAFVAALFVVTGPVLVLYLNFRPGPSIGWDQWLTRAGHEVRDRDYFFVASFVAWALWVAIALADIARRWIPRVSVQRRPAVAAIFAVAMVPLVLNFRTATRRQTAEVTMARDFAYALLQSVPVNGILFTNGDNDTFPLWYAQQVEGVRQDVSVICLSLGQTAWYIKQLSPLHLLSGPRIDSLRPFRAPRTIEFPLDGHGVARIEAGAVVNPADVLAIEVLRMNAGHRPVAWSTSAADKLFGLAPLLVQQGMALVLPIAPVDTATLVDGDAAGPGGVRLDLAATRRIIDESWRFGRLDTDGATALEANIQAVAATVAAVIGQAGTAMAMRGNKGAMNMLERAVRLGNDSLAGATIRRLMH